MAVYCRKCGAQIPDDSAFCTICGEKTEIAESAKQKTAAEILTAVATPAKKPILTEEKNGNAKKKHKLLFIVLGIIALVLLAVILLATTSGKKQNGKNTSGTAGKSKTENTANILEDKDALAKTTASILKIECYDASNNLICTGSGFSAFSSYSIVTNYHVIEDHPYSIKATAENGKTYSITKIMAYNEDMDIAVLSAKTELEPLAFADESVEKGDTVVAIGSPLGMMNVVSDGIVSGFTEVDGMSAIQFTAAISHGSSGGVLLNSAGEVVGVTFASFTEGQNMNIAIPIQYVSEFYQRDGGKSSISVLDFYKEFTSLTHYLTNIKQYEGQKITVGGYVSSLFYYNGGSLYFFLVNDKLDVVGYSNNGTPTIPQPGHPDMTQVRTASSESELAQNCEALMVFYDAWSGLENYPQPGDYVTVSGLLEYTSLFQGEEACCLMKNAIIEQK